MEYSKAMGLSIVMVTISTLYISFKYRDSIQWAVMLPFLIPTAVICGVCYGLFASGGPTAALYLLPATKNKKEYLATIQAFLCVNNIVVLMISLILGRLDMADLPMVGAGVVAMLAGTLLGLVIHDRIPSSVFGKETLLF